MTNVAFLQDIHDIDKAIEIEKSFHSRETGTLFVALSPEVMCHLDRRGFPYKIPEEFQTSVHRKKLAWDEHERLEKFLQRLSCLARMRIDGLTGDFIYYERDLFRKLYDGFLIRIHEIHSIVQEGKVETIWTRTPLIVSPVGFSLNDIPFYDLILTRIAPEWGVHVNLWASLKKSDSGFVNESYHRKRRIFRYSVKSYFYARKSYSYARGFLRGLSRQFLHHMGRRRHRYVWCLDRGIWREVIRKLEKSRLAAILYSEIESKRSGMVLDNDWQKRIMDIIASDRELQEHFVYRGESYFPIVEPFLSRYYRYILPKMHEYYNKAMRLINSKPISLILISQAVTPDRKALMLAAKHTDVPVVDWFHGGMIAGYVNKPADLWDCACGRGNYIFTWGPGSREWFVEHGAKARAFAVGGSLLGKRSLFRNDDMRHVVNTQNERRELVLIVTNTRVCRRYVTSSSTQSDTLLFLDTIKVLNVIKNHSDKYYLTVKLHPGPNNLPLEEWLSGYFEEGAHRIVHRVPSVEDLLESGDVFINMIPSTTLLQTITTRKNVFVYGNEMTFEADAIQSLKKRTYFSESISKLCRSLDFFLEKGDFKLYRSNNSFLENYGISNEAEPSALAFNLLENILS